MFKSIGSTWILNALQMAAVLVLSPWVLARLGADQNGVWVTIVAYTGVLSLLILGVPMASVRFVAQKLAQQDLAGANRVIATCLTICLLLGGAALVAGLLLFQAFDAGYLSGAQTAHLTPETVAGARTAFLVVVAQVSLGFALRLPYAVFDAHQDFVARNLVMAGEVLLRLALTLGLLAWRAELPVLAGVLVACTLFEFLVAVTVSRRRHRGVRFSLRGFDRALLRPILSFSVYALLLNVGTLLAFRVDAIVIGAFLEPLHATEFDFGNKFFDPLTGLLIAVGAVVMPAATRLQASGQAGELRAIFLKWSKVCFSLALLFGLFLLVLGPAFLAWWVGEPFRGPSGRVLQVLMASFLFYLPVRGVALPVLMGLGRPRGPALALLVMGLVNVAISLALVRPLGILGVALGTALPNAAFAIHVLRLACRELGVPLREYLGHVAGRALVGALAPLALLLALERFWKPEGFLELFVAGLVLVASFALTWVLFVYRGDPHLDLRQMLARRLARGRSA